MRTDDFRVRFPVHPLPRARSREALPPSRAKDDPTDAALQRAWLCTHRDQLQPLPPQSPTLRALEPRGDHRRRVVGDHVRLTTRLTSPLKPYFPPARQGFQDKDPRRFCDVLSRWPTRTAVQLARRSTLATFVRAHHVRSADVMTQRLDALQAATPLTTEEGIIAPQALLVQPLVSQLRVPVHAIQAVDQASAQRAPSHPDFPLGQTLPGAGPVFAPRLLVAFGAPRARSAAAAALQPFAGLAPVTERRGKKSWVHWRVPCPPVRRQTFVEWAAESIRHAFWARVYDPQPRETGTAHQAAVRALAFKWRRLLCRCGQDRTPYHASVDLHALNRRGSARLHTLPQAS